MQFIDIGEWMHYGYLKGWCGPPVCAIHDGIPMSEAEDESEDEICVHVIRLYEDEPNRIEVELNHSPSSWRASNMGWEKREQ